MNTMLLVLCLAQPASIVDADMALINRDFNRAIKLFNKEIKENWPDYGFAARAMISWNLHTAHDNLGNKRESMLALWSFIINADIYISRRPHSMWQKQYYIEDKIELARVLTDAYWAALSGKSCNSKERYCFLPKEYYLSVYAGLIPFCGSKSDTFVMYDRENIPKFEYKRDGNNVVVTSECGDKYYFRME